MMETWRLSVEIHELIGPRPPRRRSNSISISMRNRSQTPACEWIPPSPEPPDFWWTHTPSLDPSSVTESTHSNIIANVAPSQPRTSPTHPINPPTNMHTERWKQVEGGLARRLSRLQGQHRRPQSSHGGSSFDAWWPRRPGPPSHCCWHAACCSPSSIIGPTAAASASMSCSARHCTPRKSCCRKAARHYSRRRRAGPATGAA